MKTRAEGPIPVAIAFAASVSPPTRSIRTGVLPTPSLRANCRISAASGVLCIGRVPIVSTYGSTSTSTSPIATKTGPATSHQRSWKRPASRSRIVSAIVSPTTCPTRPGHWPSAHSQ